MNEFDFELKAMAKTEPAPIPAGFEGRLLAKLDRLPQTAEGTHPRTRRHILRPALIAAVLVVALLVPVCAAVWQGWLEPVVRYGDNGELIEQYTVAVDETQQGNRCDVTLENVVTDGTAVYLLFSAQYAPDFDLDFALEWGQLDFYPSRNGGMFCRIDDRSQPGTARFIGMINSATSCYPVGNLLGQEISVQLIFYDSTTREIPDGRIIRELRRNEEYYFDHVSLNDSIDLREMEWEDGTRLAISPLSAVLEFTRMLGANESWDDAVTRLNVTLEFADGTRLDFADPGISVKHQGAQISLGWHLTASGGPGMENDFVMSRQFPQLVEPETVTALIIDGVRYETADAHTPAD